MENEVSDGAGVQDPQESRQTRFQSSSTNVQIDLLRGLHAELEQEGMSHITRCIYVYADSVVSQR